MYQGCSPENAIVPSFVKPDAAVSELGAYPRKTIETRLGRMSYRRGGSGPALLLMHGIGGNADSWRRQFPAFARRHDVIAWDAPGFGKSPALPQSAPVAADYAAALARLLLAAGLPGAAATISDDPAWRGTALYAAGRYAEAAEAFAGQPYNRGNALALAGDLKGALAAYEAALARDPGDEDAKANRELVARLLDTPDAPGGRTAGEANARADAATRYATKTESDANDPGTASSGEGLAGHREASSAAESPGNSKAARTGRAEQRAVDPGRIVFLAAGQWSSRLDMLGPPFAPNLAYTYHSFWSSTERDSIQRHLNFAALHEVPLLLGEVGATDPTSSDFVPRMLGWAHDHGAGALLWVWAAQDDPMSLTTGLDGAPSVYGRAAAAWLRTGRWGA